MTTHHQVLAVLAAVVILGTACSSGESGTPVPATSAPSATADGPADTPAVENPLDLASFLPEPCAVLTQPQLATLGVTGGGEPTTTGATAESVGPWCTWLTTGTGKVISVGFLTLNEDGMATVYDKRDDYKYFEPTTVEDYPAVFAEPVDHRDNGSCNIFVGISDTTVYRAATQGESDAASACDRAKQVAAAALTTIREGN